MANPSVNGSIISNEQAMTFDTNGRGAGWASNNKESCTCTDHILRQAEVYSELFGKLEKCKSDHSKAIKKFEEKINALSETNNDLKSKLDVREEEFQQLTALSKAAIQKYKEIDESLTHAKDRLRSKNAAVDYLNSKVKSLRERRKRDQRKSKALVEELQSSITELRNEIEGNRNKQQISEFDKLAAVSESRLKERESVELRKENQKKIEQKIEELTVYFYAKDKELKETAQKLCEITAQLEKEQAHGKYLETQLEKRSEEVNAQPSNPTPAITFSFAPATERPSGLNANLPTFPEALGRRLMKNMQDAPFRTVAPMRPEFFRQECEPIEMPDLVEEDSEPEEPASPIREVIFKPSIQMSKLRQTHQSIKEIEKKYCWNT